MEACAHQGVLSGKILTADNLQKKSCRALVCILYFFKNCKCFLSGGMYLNIYIYVWLLLKFAHKFLCVYRGIHKYVFKEKEKEGRNHTQLLTAVTSEGQDRGLAISSSCMSLF